MKKTYVEMSESELLKEILRRYGEDFDPNDKPMLRELLKTDDGLLTEFFRKNSMAY